MLKVHKWKDRECDMHIYIEMNSNREFIECFWRLKMLCNLKKNTQCANTDNYTHQWYITSKGYTQTLTNIFVQSTTKHAHTNIIIIRQICKNNFIQNIHALYHIRTAPFGRFTSVHSHWEFSSAFTLSHTLVSLFIHTESSP